MYLSKNLDDVHVPAFIQRYKWMGSRYVTDTSRYGDGDELWYAINYQLSDSDLTELLTSSIYDDGESTDVTIDLRALCSLIQHINLRTVLPGVISDILTVFIQSITRYGDGNGRTIFSDNDDAYIITTATSTLQELISNMYAAYGMETTKNILTTGALWYCPPRSVRKNVLEHIPDLEQALEPCGRDAAYVEAALGLVTNVIYKCKTKRASVLSHTRTAGLAISGGLLHFAAYSGDVDMLNALLIEGADVNDRQPHDVPPVVYAVANNNIEAVKLFMKSGASVNDFNNVRVSYTRD